MIIDAGGDGSDPENAVPFSIKTEDGKNYKQPGNLFFLVESSLYGTEPKWSTKGDLDGDGKVEFGEALPDPRFYLAAVNEFDKQAGELDGSAKEWSPTEQDALTALVVMTPTMSEYFEAWKNSRFVAGDKATEKSFVGASRLQDIADILGGLEADLRERRAEDRRGEPGAGRADRAVADRARGVRRPPARPGGRRQEVHRRGRRHARPPGAGPGRGDRRADHPGRQAAEHRARDVSASRLGHRLHRRGARRRGAGPRRRREHPVAERRPHPAGARLGAQEAQILGTRAEAVRDVRRARAAYRGRCGGRCARRRRPPTGPLRRAFAVAERAARDGDRRLLAAARGEARAATFGGAYTVTLNAAGRGDATAPALVAAAARLPHRHALHAPGADGTAAVGGSPRASWPRAARLAVAKDLLDAYQARLRELLKDVDTAHEKGFATGEAEAAAQAAGYWQILAARYEQDRGARRGRHHRRLHRAARRRRDRRRAGRRQRPLEIDQALDGFTAAPFTAEESARRAQQLLRFVALVPVEYGRGVKEGRVTLDFEVQEAIAFAGAADAAFDDLRDQLAKHDAARTDAVGAELDPPGGRRHRRRAQEDRRHLARRRRGAGQEDRGPARRRDAEGGRSRPTTPTTT